jgi:hypothetical protein
MAATTSSTVRVQRQHTQQSTHACTDLKKKLIVALCHSSSAVDHQIHNSIFFLLSSRIVYSSVPVNQLFGAMQMGTRRFNEQVK